MNAQAKVEVAMNVHRKLSTARQRFHSLKLEKTGENKFAGYKYFELGDFLIPALKVFDEIGLSAVVTFKSDIAAMQITDMDNTSDTIIITSPMGSAALKGCHEVQNIGAVETYQRRYLWVAALEIVEHDALDATNGKSAPIATGEVVPLKPEKLDGPYSSPSKLKAAIKAFAEALRTSNDDLAGFSAWLATPEVVELEKAAMRYVPEWWEDGMADKPEYEPIASRIYRKKRALEEAENMHGMNRTVLDAG